MTRVFHSNKKYIYPSEYNVYSCEGVFSSYRMAYGVAQKNYFIYNHLGSKTVEVDSVGNIIDYVQYSPFCEPLKKNNYQPQWNERLCYIDQEKDRESKLGDHGVRKYDNEIGRFTSIDPLFEKFHGWSPYNYSFNNPINLVDRSGEAADVLIDLGFIAYDLYDMGKSFFTGKPITSTQVGALGADIASAVTPLFVGGGLIVRAGAKADDAANITTKVLKSNNLWTLTKEGASEIKSHKLWGTFYKSKSDNLWWAIDKTGHGKSKFKVFKEGKKGLEWYKDADEYGNFIEGKHKSDVGTFLHWNNFKTIK